MVYKFRILSDEVDNFVREIAIDSDALFLDLHQAILDCTQFSADQMCSFFICNDDWEKETEVTLIEMDNNPEVDSWIMSETRLSELVDDEGQKLLYVFDYLTERALFVELFQLIPNRELKNAKCLLSEGEPPIQQSDLNDVGLDTALKTNIDDIFSDDQDFDINELDAEGFSGLDDIPDPSSDREF